MTQPDGASAFEDEGLPAFAEGEEPMEPPHDTAFAVEDFGTTSREVHDGEPLTGRLAREEPDVLSAVDTPADESVGETVGRLVEPDEGARGDVDAEMVATDVGPDLGGQSAEESAMHVEHEA